MLMLLGGHLFHSMDECAEFFNIPTTYVEHMLVSDKYEGCIGIVQDDIVSFLQTLALMKSTDC